MAVSLTTRNGKEIENPSQGDLSQAMKDLSPETPAEQTEIFLRCETDDGPIYLLSVDRDGTVSFSEFANHEADDPSVELTKKVSLEKALELLTLVSRRKGGKSRG